MFFQLVPLHKIPNMALGTVGRRHVTRIFFPRLYDPRKKVCPIPLEVFKRFYDSCLRPAAVIANAADASRWPINYSIALRHIRDKQGRFHFGALEFPAHGLEVFSKKLMEYLGQHEDLKDAFFVHQFRGTKAAYRHDPKDPAAQQNALDLLYKVLRRDLINPKDWYIDVGMEIRIPGHVLQWRTSCHARLLAFLLPNGNNVENIVKGSSAIYNCDLSAQISDLGGFRSHPESRGKADQVSYINVYTTEKSVTYQHHDGVFRRRRAWNLFPAYAQKLVLDTDYIQSVFHECSGYLEAPVQEGSARIEVRVPLSTYHQTLATVPPDHIINDILKFPPNIFWCVIVVNLMDLEVTVMQFVLGCLNTSE